MSASDDVNGAHTVMLPVMLTVMFFAATAIIPTDLFPIRILTILAHL